MLALLTAGISAGLCALGVHESRRIALARKAVPIRVHVNGTRGKSNVTRLIAAGLRAAGVRTLAKVTGTQARWILPSGEEMPVARVGGRARIHEQVAALRYAHELGCEALVVECMALHPEMQWASEHQILRSTVGVITNARLDHADLMGWDPAMVARVLANTTPRDGVVVCGDEAVAGMVDSIAGQRNTRVVVAARSGLERPRYTADPVASPPENIAIAQAVLNCLGVPVETSRRALAAVGHDPGTARWTYAVERAGGGHPRGKHSRGNRPLWMILHALAANDPLSLEILMRAAMKGWAPESLVCVYHHRHDRGDRALLFARFFNEMARAGFEREPSRGHGIGGAAALSGIWLTGDRLPSYVFPREWVRGHYATPEAALRDGCGLDPVPAPYQSALPSALHLVVLCGNTRGALGWEHRWPGWQPVEWSPWVGREHG